jgi:uncharacterized membrane protein
MKLLEKLFLPNKKTNQLLICFTIYCFALLLIRAKLTHTLYLFFLIWNLVLAYIPYAITTYLLNREKQYTNKYLILIPLLLWLLFLPNSFYMVTDLIHLTRSHANSHWMDLIIISSYACIGFVLGLLSLLDFEKLFSRHYPSHTLRFIIPLLCVLCGLGIYMGRILRFNSWDILNQPLSVCYALHHLILTRQALLFTLHFGVFIYFAYALQKKQLI